MQWISVLIVAALTFGVCYLFDKGFAKLFRNREQHKSGLAVRLHKRYAVVGVLLMILGVAALFVGFDGSKTLLIGGVIVLLMGAGLIVYYLSFGVFYDADSFVLSTFGKKDAVYRFGDIKEQRLYAIQGGSLVVELHLADGQALSLQSTMEGMMPFLDHAFAAWCRQTGRDPENCPFHDPANAQWFPGGEDA